MAGRGRGVWYVDKATIYVPFCVFAYLRLSTQRLFFSKGRFFVRRFLRFFSVFWVVKPPEMRPKIVTGGRTVRV